MKSIAGVADQSDREAVDHTEVANAKINEELIANHCLLRRMRRESSLVPSISKETSRAINATNTVVSPTNREAVGSSRMKV